MKKTDQLRKYFLFYERWHDHSEKTCPFSLITPPISSFYIQRLCGNKKCHIKCEKNSQNFKPVFFPHVYINVWVLKQESLKRGN